VSKFVKGVGDRWREGGRWREGDQRLLECDWSNNDVVFVLWIAIAEGRLVGWFNGSKELSQQAGVGWSG
jgi:hypothetical protein